MRYLFALLFLFCTFAAHADTFAYLSNGTSCGGAPLTSTVAVTPRVNFSVCLISNERLCGLTYRFRPDTLLPAGARLRINSVTHGTTFLDIIQPEKVYPYYVTQETSTDLGAVVFDTNLPAEPGAGILVATYNLSVLGSKPGTLYSLALDKISSVAVDIDGACGRSQGPKEVPVFAAYTVVKR